MIDAHAHLNYADYDGDRAAVLERARAAGLDKVLFVLVDFLDKDVKIFRQLLAEQAFIYGSVGVHPHEAKNYGHFEPLLKELLALPKIIALGETGLDYHYDLSPRDIQQEVFRKQLKLAREKDLPVIIHCREAYPDCLKILEEEKISCGLMHCFSGGPAELEKCLALGFYISLDGPITFKNAQQPKEIIKLVPADRLILETDSPYLTPHPRRGERNEPSYVKYIYEQAANLRGLTLPELIIQVDGNFRRLYNLS